MPEDPKASLKAINDRLDQMPSKQWYTRALAAYVFALVCILAGVHWLLSVLP